MRKVCFCWSLPAAIILANNNWKFVGYLWSSTWIIVFSRRMDELVYAKMDSTAVFTITLWIKVQKNCEVYGLEWVWINLVLFLNLPRFSKAPSVHTVQRRYFILQIPSSQASTFLTTSPIKIIKINSVAFADAMGNDRTFK